MKPVIFILIVLFFVITPVSGQPLSDATGIINRLDVQTSGYAFEIKLTSNFDLTDYTFDKDEKQITLYFDSALENNLAEIIIPKDLLSGNFMFYLNDQEFLPRVESNKQISFITLNFTGSGTNVVKIIGSEYLVGLDSITSSDILPLDSEFLFNNYFIWLVFGSILIVIITCIVIIIRKIKK
ncbi:MAG: hypothetical protein ABR53_00335 [Nitrosopumilus sp. BACL13 MAG-121220-bin23]|nr:MAG: hypothetical protein ABR53_00335 [Nitrosopumilus sp. BACL13 MAG-121220-bin23]